MSKLQTSDIRVPSVMEGSAIAMASGFGTATIKAVPEAMEQKAADIKGRIARIRAEFNDMTQAVERTGSYWNGEAAELHRKSYHDMLPRMHDMLSCLEEHAANLQEIAQKYIDVSARVTGLTSALPKDAIE